jgi:crossover junction endodeoxyribonuclease RuvC
MRVLGIDPGLNQTGYGVVVRDGRQLLVLDAGLVRPGPASTRIEERLAALYDGVFGILARHQPGALALEEVFSHGRFPGSALWIAHARAVVCLAAAKADVPVESYAPATVKQAITGYGRATKEQVQHMVGVRLGADAPRSADVADALALAITHLDAVGSVMLSAAKHPAGRPPVPQTLRPAQGDK